VVDIWFKYLANLRSNPLPPHSTNQDQQEEEGGEGNYQDEEEKDQMIDNQENQQQQEQKGGEDEEELTEAQISEGIDILKKVLDSRVRLLGEHHIATGEVQYTLV